jgi:hypothetical protein
VQLVRRRGMSPAGVGLVVIFSIMLAVLVAFLIYSLVYRRTRTVSGAACRINAPATVTAQLGAKGGALALTDPTMPAWVQAQNSTAAWKYWVPIWVGAKTQTAAFWAALGVEAAEQRLELNPLYPTTGGTNKYPLFNGTSHAWPGTPDSAALAIDSGPIPCWPYKQMIAGPSGPQLSYGWATTEHDAVKAPAGETALVKAHGFSLVTDQFAQLEAMHKLTPNPGINQFSSSWAAAAAAAQGLTLPAGMANQICGESNTVDPTSFDFSQNLGHLHSQIFHQLAIDGQARVDSFRYRYGLVGGSFSVPDDTNGNGVGNIEGMTLSNNNSYFTAIRDMWAVGPTAADGTSAYIAAGKGKPVRLPMPDPIAGMPLSTTDLVVRGLRAGKTRVKIIPSYVTDALGGKTPADSKAKLLQGTVNADNLVRWLAFTPEQQRGPAKAGGPAPHTFVQRPVAVVGPTAQHCFGDEGGLCTTYADALHEDFTDGLRACRWGHSAAKGFAAYGLGVSDKCRGYDQATPATDNNVPSVDLATDYVKRYWETEGTVKPVLILRTVVNPHKPFGEAGYEEIVTKVGATPTIPNVKTAYGCHIDPDSKKEVCPPNPATSGNGFQTLSNGNVTTSRLYGSCYIEVTAKFADVSQVVNAIWTFTAADGQPDAPWMPARPDTNYTRSLWENSEIDIELPSNDMKVIGQVTKDGKLPDPTLNQGIPQNYLGTYSPSGYTAAGGATHTAHPTYQDERYAAAEDHVPSAYGTDHGTRPAAGTGSGSGYRSATDYQFSHATGADTRRAAAAFSSSAADFQATTMGPAGAAVGAAAYKAEYSPFNSCGTEPCKGLPAVTVGSDTVEGLLPLGVDDSLNAGPSDWCCPNSTNTANYNSYSSTNNSGANAVGYVNIPMVAPEGNKAVFGDGEYHTYAIEWHAGSTDRPAVIHWFQDGVYQASSNVFVPNRMGRIVIGSIATGGHPWTWSGIASNFNNANPESAVSDVHIVPLEEESDYYTPQAIDQALQWRLRAGNRIAISIGDAFHKGDSTPVPEWAPYWGMTDLTIDPSPPKAPTKGATLQGFKLVDYSDDKAKYMAANRPTANYTASAKTEWDARVAALQTTAADRQGIFVVPFGLAGAAAAPFQRTRTAGQSNPHTAYIDPQPLSPLDDGLRNRTGIRARCLLTADGSDKLLTYDKVAGGEADVFPRLDFATYKQLDNPFSNDDLQDATTVPAPAGGAPCTSNADCPLQSGNNKATTCHATAPLQPGGTPPASQCELLVCGDPPPGSTSLGTDCKKFTTAEECCGARVPCSGAGYGSGVCYGTMCPVPTDLTQICIDRPPPDGLVKYGYKTNDYLKCLDYINTDLVKEGWFPTISVDKGAATWTTPTDSDGSCPGPAQGTKAAAAGCTTLGTMYTDGGGADDGKGTCKYSPAPVCSCFTGYSATCPGTTPNQCPATASTDDPACKCSCVTDHNLHLSHCVLAAHAPCTAPVQCSSGKCNIKDGEWQGTCEPAGGTSVCPCFRGFAAGETCKAASCDSMAPPVGHPDCKCLCNVTKEGQPDEQHGCLLDLGAPCVKGQCGTQADGTGLKCDDTTGKCVVDTGPTSGCSCFTAIGSDPCPAGCPATNPEKDPAGCNCTCVTTHGKQGCQLGIGSPCTDKNTCASGNCDLTTNTCQAAGPPVGGCSCQTGISDAACLGCPAKTPSTDPAGCVCTCTTTSSGQHGCQLDIGSPCLSRDDCASYHCTAGKCATA